MFLPLKAERTGSRIRTPWPDTIAVFSDIALSLFEPVVNYRSRAVAFPHLFSKQLERFLNSLISYP
jgi:hypothetical protein